MTNTTTQPIPTTHKTVNVANLFYLVLAILVTTVISFKLFRPILVLPRIQLAPGFALKNLNNQTITSEDLRGQFTFYTFTHTTCGHTEPCPQSITDITTLHNHISQAAPPNYPLNIITIFLGEEDTPTAVQKHLSQHPLPPTNQINWQLIPHDPLRTKFIVGHGFSIYYKQTPTHLNFDPRIILVDGLGLIRAIYHTPNPDPTIIQRDINLLTAEAQNSTGLAKLGYEAAHLFVCYP